MQYVSGHTAVLVLYMEELIDMPMSMMKRIINKLNCYRPKGWWLSRGTYTREVTTRRWSLIEEKLFFVKIKLSISRTLILSSIS